MILFLFLAHLAVGIVFTLVFVSREAGVKFFRFNAGLAAILLAVAFAFRPPEASATERGAAGRARARRARGGDASSTGRRSAARSPRSARPSSAIARRRRARRARRAGARPRRRARRDAGADRRQLPQLGGASRRRLHGDDSRPLVSRHPVAAGVAPAVDRQGAHRVDGRARGGRGGRRRSWRSSTLAARPRARASAATSCR